MRSVVLFSLLLLVGSIERVASQPIASREVASSSSLTRIDASGIFLSAESRMNTGVQRFAVDAHALAQAARFACASRADGDARDDRLVLERFPMHPDEVTLSLRRARAVVDGRTHVIIGSASGDRRVPLPEVECYRGGIEGIAGSSAFLAIAGDVVFGYVERPGEPRVVIGPDVSASKAESGLHVFVEEAVMIGAIAGTTMFECLAERTEGYHRGLFAPMIPGVDSSDLLEVAVAVEVDSVFFARTGGTVARATGYAIALFSMVSSIYEDETGMTLRLPWIKVWESDDPYHVAGNGYALWLKVPAYWQQNYASVERDLAHVMTSSDWGGGGISFRGEAIDGGLPSLCSNERGYSMSSPRGVLSYPTFAFTYDVYIVAHELGHNFGARHTHDCWWAPSLDTCRTWDDSVYVAGDACHSRPITPRPSRGSIMSYCMAINQANNGGTFEAWKVALDLTPRVAAVMRHEVELSGCRHSPSRPTIVLTHPRGAEPRFAGDTVIDITWRSESVSRIALLYSPDAGATWRTIAADVPVQPEVYRWSVGDICASDVLVRALAVGDSTVADTTLIPFAIQGAPSRPVITRSGDTLVASDGAAWQWSRDGVAVPNGVARTYVPRESGRYTVSVTTHGGCTSTSDAVTVEVSGVEPGEPVIVRFDLTVRAE